MKTIVDPVHGSVNFPDYIVEIINTAEFQRLKYLKQLGVSNLVFPGATHTRYEHCLGVCYLAGQLMGIIEKNNGIEISPLLRKCVEIAGLLHDTGHGPFSHMWEEFVHMGQDQTWTHEESSCRMTNHLFEKNQILLSDDPIEHMFCLELIKALIVGDTEAWKVLVMPEHYFITEIVNNKFCFIDVDKWDYLLRDNYYLKNAMDTYHKDFQKFFYRARVTADKEYVTHISYHVDDLNHIYEMFENRSNFHIKCYQHPTTLGVEQLIFDALIMVENSGFTFKGCKLTQAQQSEDVYTYLNDTIINIILATDDPNVFKSRQLLIRLNERRLYKIVWSGSLPIQISHLNNKFGKHFFIKHKKIPYAGQIMPKSIFLHNDNGNVVDPHVTFSSGFYEEYIVYCTSESSSLIKNVKKYLEQNHRTLTSMS